MSTAMACEEFTTTFPTPATVNVTDLMCYPDVPFDKEAYDASTAKYEKLANMNALLVVSLVALLSSGLGVALGALVQRIQPVMAVSFSISLYLFFLAGGNAVLAFEPVVLQNIASFDPLTYGRHALEMALFYQSSDQLGRDIAVLACSALATIGLGTMAMSRGMAH